MAPVRARHMRRLIGHSLRRGWEWSRLPVVRPLWCVKDVGIWSLLPYRAGIPTGTSVSQRAMVSRPTPAELRDAGKVRDEMSAAKIISGKATRTAHTTIACAMALHAGERAEGRVAEGRKKRKKTLKP